MKKAQAFELAGGKAKNPSYAALCLEKRNANILARVAELQAMGAETARGFIEGAAVGDG
jgi:hypothetical protein